MFAKDFLSIRDFTPQDIRHFLHVACQVKANPSIFADALKGKTLAMIFEKPSLRTRVTFDVGMEQLGGHALYLSPAEINLGKRESVHDVAKNLERIGDHTTNIAETIYYAVNGQVIPDVRPKGDTSAYAVVRPKE